MTIKTDICVIGAGSGGLSVAVAATQMGASTVLIESGKMGGDCLNYGCVPSKSLLASAKAVHMIERQRLYGLKGQSAQVDHGLVHDHVFDVIKTIAPHDSVERMESLGIRVFKGQAYFITRKLIKVGNQIIQARRFVIATGSSPAIPPIPGLHGDDAVHFFTNETIFDVQAHLKHLIIIGGGPIGVEMAQAHCRLGSKVTVIQRSRLMPRDDGEAVDVIRHKLVSEGVKVYEHSETLNVRKDEQGNIIVAIRKGAESINIQGSHLLVATGRQSNVDSLRLEVAGVVYSEKGIQVNENLRTSNRKIYAVGDVIGQHLFTHMASFHASVVVRNMIFGFPRAKAKSSAVPWVTYTDPEIAQVGLTESQARARLRNSHLRILRWNIMENDRVQAERAADAGLIKVICTRRGKVLGATIVSPHAGELLLPWSLAITEKLNIKAIAKSIVAYPTVSEISKRVAGSFYTPVLFGEKMRRVVRFLMHFR
ncbi:MAG: FAD-dependent oxidoreductase [Pseudomonadota bacterium]